MDQSAAGSSSPPLLRPARPLCFPLEMEQEAARNDLLLSGRKSAQRLVPSLLAPSIHSQNQWFTRLHTSVWFYVCMSMMQPFTPEWLHALCIWHRRRRLTIQLCFMIRFFVPITIRKYTQVSLLTKRSDTQLCDAFRSVLALISWECCIFLL